MSSAAGNGAPGGEARPAGLPAPLGRPGPSWDGSGLLGRPAGGAAREPAARDAAGRPRGADAGLDLRRDGSVAGVGRRAVGFVADELTHRLILFLMLVFTGTDVDSPGFFAIAMVIPVAYHWTFDSLGWSPGKRVAGLRLVNDRGRPPGLFAGGVRAVIVLLVPFYLSYVWAIWDSRVQTLHDKAARTYVVPLAELPEADPERG